MSAATARRSSAERRAELVEVATRHFATGGFAGTSTEAIAREAGISQPYLFRLFGTKKELFLACSAEMTGRIRRTFERAAEGVPEDARLPAMGKAYAQLLADRVLLRMQLQTHAAAAADPELRERARRDYVSVVDTVHRLTGVTGEELRRFIATGMLLNVMAALELAGLDSPEDFHRVRADPVTRTAPPG